MNVREYIRESWNKSIRERGHRADGIQLPYAYTSPCAEGIFDEFYYWDTYFINVGLIEDGRIAEALRNALNCAYLIEEYGFMPNAAVLGMLNRSQPPLFCWMCRDLFSAAEIDARSRTVLIAAMKKEYSFWMRERVLPCGLNHYGTSADDQTKVFMAKEAEGRVGITFGEGSAREVGENVLAECESGWDFSPRFCFQCAKYAPVDLNSLLYSYEKLLSEYSQAKREREYFLQMAKRRREKMYRFCLEGNRLVDSIPGARAHSVTSVAEALPYAVGLSKDKEELVKILKKLECENGLAACEEADVGYGCQWGYPNMWAPLVYFMYLALCAVGAKEDAKRIGEKYVAAVDKTFLGTGKLWEKYSAQTGYKADLNEYAETEMLGWTAGVYNFIERRLREGHE